MAMCLFLLVDVVGIHQQLVLQQQHQVLKFYPYFNATLFTTYLAGSLQLQKDTQPMAVNILVQVQLYKNLNQFHLEMFLLQDGVKMLANDYDVDRVTVWPNPYCNIIQKKEMRLIDVMFSHLPTEGPATIRIFALDGTLVRTIKHNDTGSSIPLGHEEQLRTSSC